ncbi:hypothetical protein ACCO45_002129 [Purpureocillium lilacinum]|uniref:Uncharacterized protein n=1 Tax=Purpureocillium lilacinum TaxID=33203 RepID=A0ACC4E8Z6_PURLI
MAPPKKSARAQLPPPRHHHHRHKTSKNCHPSPKLPSSSKTPVVYVSSSTPFMSAVRRVQKYLDRSLRNATAAAPRNASLHARVEGLRRRAAAASATTASGQSRGSAAAGGADGETMPIPEPPA